MQAADQGKRFLFRSAASLLTALAQLPPQPVSAEQMREYVRNNKAGAIIVGSHVKKTTQQLNYLLQQNGVKGIEINVEKIASNQTELLEEITSLTQQYHSENITPVIYTSRTELKFDNPLLM